MQLKPDNSDVQWLLDVLDAIIAHSQAVYEAPNVVVLNDRRKAVAPSARAIGQRPIQLPPPGVTLPILD